MAGPKDVLVRQPAVAGAFYPAEPDRCRALAISYTAASGAEEPAPWLGGVVPHAGWICSGALAGQTISTIAQGVRAELVVVFGAIHTPIPTTLAALDTYARWELPGASSDVRLELRSKALEHRSLFCTDDRFHRREHAIEVELPLIQAVWPNAAILPIEVPSADEAVKIGQETAGIVAASGQRAVFLASSDLTHYGPSYGFVPAGVGPAAMAWAKQNDRRLLDKILSLSPESIVPEVRAHFNACGAGAIAAMLAACRELGATRARLLRHATSFETLAEVAPQRPDNAVGYAAIVVG